MNELLWWFGQNSLAALLMIPCVWLSCRLFRDSPAVQHLLWLVILVKFITPPIIVWPWSLDELRGIAWSQDTEYPAVSVHLPPTITKAESAETSPQSFDPIEVVSTDSVPAVPPVASIEIVSAQGEIAAASSEVIKVVEWSRLVGYTIFGAWLGGAITCFIVQMRRLVLYARLILKGASSPEHLRGQIAGVATLLRTKAPISLVVNSIASPFLWCVGVVRLAWPESLSSVADVKRSRCIIAHELAHLRRRDHWITWMELGASILWWWNPLFWYVRRQLRETAEMSCDALAISAAPESRHEYAELLLQLSSDSGAASVTPVLAMSSVSTRSFERRLSMVLSTRVSGSSSWKGILMVAVLAAITLPHWSLAQSTTPDDTDPKPAKDQLVTENVQSTPMKDDALIPELEQLTVQVIDADRDKPTSSVYLTLWRALTEGDVEPENTVNGRAGFGYYNPIIWDDEENNARWIRAGSAHPNDGRHGKSAETFTFRNLKTGKYRITAVSYQSQERTPDPTPYGVTVPIEVNGITPTEIVIKLRSGDANATVKLIDAETRLPISAAAIRLRDSHGMPIVHGHGSGNFFEWTGIDGAIQFRKLVPGNYSIEVLGKQASVNNFVEYAPVEEWTSFTATTGSNTAEVAVTPRVLSDDEISKRFPFSVFGSVTDEQGNPLADVEIRAATGSGTLRGGGTVRSDVDGSYRLYFGPGMMMRIGEYAPMGVGLQAAHFFADGGNRKIVGQKDGYYSLLMSDRTNEQILDEIRKRGQVWGRKDTADVIFANQPRQLDFVLSQPTDKTEEKDEAASTEEIDEQSGTKSESTLPKSSSILPASPVRPLKVTVSAGNAFVLDDHSIRLEGDVSWQEATAHYSFDHTTSVHELRLELLPVDTPTGPQLGRGGKKLILFDIKASVKEQAGESMVREFSSCVSLHNLDDDETAYCIDAQSDTGWTVPVLPAGTTGHTLILRFDEPVTLQPGQQLVLTVESGGSDEFALLNRVRFAFHQTASEMLSDSDEDAEVASSAVSKETFRLPEHRSVQSIAFRPGNQELVSLAWDSNSETQGLGVTVRSWSLEEAKLTSDVELEWQSDWSQFASNVRLSQDATRVVGLIGDTICLWDTASGKIIKRHAIPADIKNDNRYSVSLSHLVGTPDLSRIAFGRSVSLGGALPNAHAVVMDTNSGHVQQKVLMQARVQVNALALSPDGKRLATVGSQYGATIWDVDTGEILLDYQNTNSNRKHPDPKVNHNSTKQVLGAGFSPDGKWLALCDMLGIKIVNVATGQVRNVIDAPWRYHDRQTQFVFSADGQLVSLLGTYPEDGEPRTTSVWSTATGQRLRTLSIFGQAAAFSPDVRWFAVGTSDPKEALAVWRNRED